MKKQKQLLNYFIRKHLLETKWIQTNSLLMTKNSTKMNTGKFNNLFLGHDYHIIRNDNSDFNWGFLSFERTKMQQTLWRIC